jgi:tetratricopeptide (TPR) repeat protein
MRKTLLIILTVVFLAAVFSWSNWFFSPTRPIKHKKRPVKHASVRVPDRPEQTDSLYDWADMTGLHTDSIRGFLKNFRKEFNIEFVMVTTKSVAPATIEEYAESMVQQWRIGEGTEGKGLLLVVSQMDKAIKMEVSYELEDVFTDLFCSTVTREYLQPFLEIGNVGLGMQGYIELITNLAWDSIDNGKLVTETTQTSQKNRPLSGGAGVVKTVDIGGGKKFTYNLLTAEEKKYFSAQETPEKTMERYIEYIMRRIYDRDVGILADSSRVRNASFNTGQYKTECKLIADGLPYRVKQQGDYAVILFRPEAEWSCPVFMKKENDGWKVDSVTELLYVVYDYNNKWLLRANMSTPFDFALQESYIRRDCWTFGFEDYPEYLRNMKMPIRDKVAYFEEAIKKNPGDPQAHLYLGAVLIVECNLPREGDILVEKALQLAPDNMEYKRIAGCLYATNFKFRRAAELYSAYVKAHPGLFGFSRLGFCYRRLELWEEALKCYEEILRIDKNNSHAKKQLSECMEKLVEKEKKRNR